MTTDKSKNFFRVSAEDFKKIPGSPIAYWSTPKVRTAFTSGIVLKSVGDTRQGMATSDNNRFLRHWFEVAFSRCEFDAIDRNTAKISRKKWFPYNKGGDFRKWYGNMEFMVNWENDGKELLDYAASLYGSPTRTIKSISEYFKPSISWSKISSGELAMRYYPAGFIFDVAGCCIFSPIESNLYFLLGYMNSKVARHILDFISPTVNYEAGQIATLPVIEACGQKHNLAQIISAFCEKAKNDWDSYETSWDFQMNPLCVSPQERAEQLSYGIHSEERAKAVSLISERYMRLRLDWQQQTEEMRDLEIKNNRIFIDAYGLQDELSPEVPWNEITLTCNPWYRYGKNPEDMDSLGNNLKIDHTTGKVAVSLTPEIENSKDMFPYAAETEQRLLEDTIKEFISYAVGCLMGRYSPEKSGLIFAGGEFSDQWSVISGQLVRNEEVEKYVREELSRVTGLAEEYGVGDDCVSTDKTSAEGRNICVGKSNAQSSSLNSIQYCRGTSQKLYEGIRELSLDSKGLQCGSGNPTYDLCSPEILDAISNRNGSELMRRGWQDAERIDWQAIHKAVINNQWAVDSNQKKADHCSLATNNSKSDHWSLVTDHSKADHHSLTTNHLKPKTDHWPLTTGHFHPDRDGVLPILDEEWFFDDIVTQFKAFVALTFGEENLTANMDFIEAVLGKDIRKYFVKDFYKEHIQRYKKRPIYWLFSSPKGSFNALIYLHRYTPDTVSIVLNEYLRELMTKLSTRIKHLIEENNRADISNADKTRNLKQIDKYTAQLAELEDYERDVIFPLAQQKIAIDLDDGVKVNYCKFGAALKKIPGLEAKEE